MTSSISWLDASTAEQQRMREILGLFTEKESREELGLGQIRDAIGDALFPGSSTLHTRAKYFLFIPWCYQQVSGHRGTLAQARQQELALVQTLRLNGRGERGIIGAAAGSTLKTLPSAVYWSALGRYGILTDPRLTREQALALEGADGAGAAEDGARPQLRAWRATLPQPPAGFPQEVPNGMDLQPDEAAWLQERLLDSAQGTLLAHLAAHMPHPESTAPWEDPVASRVDGEPRILLDHARRLSETMQGAQLLYNLLIAESYESEGLTRQEGSVDRFTERLDAWTTATAEQRPWASWDLDDFFTRVTMERSTPVAPGSERFVRAWAELLNRAELPSLAFDPEARNLIQTRERQNKGVMARIGNRKRLESWGGSSGAGRYTYRWGYVQAVLRDIHDGLGSASPSALPAESVGSDA